MSSVQLGDYGFKVIVNVKDSNHNPRDLTGATNLKLVLRAAVTPALVRSFTGTAENLAQGAISYTVAQGVIDALGDWQAEAMWMLSGVPGHSTFETVFTCITTITNELVIRQLFCTVSDLVADKQAPGIDEERMMQAIFEASEYVQKEIGWFVPVTLTRLLQGSGTITLFVPPLLSVTSVLNYAFLTRPLTLTADDYMLLPNNGFWANGPYTQIVFKPNRMLISWSNYPNGVQIEGQWGKYLRIGLVNATINETTYQDDAQTTLKVSNGGAVSPGMILLVGSEQEVVTGWSDPTTNITALNGAITASDEVLVVNDGSLVNVGETIRVDFEKMRVKDRRTNQLSVTRSWNGTGKVAHLNNAQVDVYRTVTVERHVNGTISAAHANATPLARYLVPDDILFLVKEIATLSANKALSGYQGRTGNAETGVVFYNDAFPKFDIDKIKNNYYIPRIR